MSAMAVEAIPDSNTYSETTESVTPRARYSETSLEPFTGVANEYNSNAYSYNGEIKTDTFLVDAAETALVSIICSVISAGLTGTLVISVAALMADNIQSNAAAYAPYSDAVSFSVVRYEHDTDSWSMDRYWKHVVTYTYEDGSQSEVIFYEHNYYS